MPSAEAPTLHGVFIVKPGGRTFLYAVPSLHEGIAQATKTLRGQMERCEIMVSIDCNEANVRLGLKSYVDPQVGPHLGVFPIEVRS